MSKRVNERGNVIYDSFHFQRERYYYDVRLCRRGWRQYDTNQDAWYFGVWVNFAKRMVLTFAEGDAFLVVCPTDESLGAELEAMAAFYGEPPPAFRVIHEDGSRTFVYDPRPAVGEKP